MKLNIPTNCPFIGALSVLVLPQAVNAALLVHLPFDGDASDATGNTSGATLNNGAVVNMSGRFGGALDVTSANAGGAPTGGASNAVVAAGTHLDSAFSNNAMAVSFHQFNNATQASSSFWIHSPGAGANERGFQAHATWSDGTIYFDQSGCCGATQRLTTTGVILGQWQHFVFQRDADGNLEIWIDGALANSSTGVEALDAFNGIITIGSEGNNANNGFDGLIDDFAVFDRALTPAEIQNFSTNPIPEPGSALLGLLGAGLLMAKRRRS
ncbi:MAG: LamG domain-containing protein [Akkermansiaceae bacterium]|jgi:hypothetical protein